MWRGFWDVAFCGASLLLTILFGAAVGNVVRGVPLDTTGNFQGSFALALNPFAILVGVLSLALLAMHGANYLAYKTDGEQQARARQWAGRLWPVVGLLTVAVTGFAFAVRPGVGANFRTIPALLMLPLLALGALVAVRVAQKRGKDGQATVAGSVFLAALMGSAGASLYPSLLPPLGGPTGGGLTIFNAAAPHHNLVTAFVTVVISMTMVLCYSAYIHRVFRGTVKVGPDEHGY